MTASINFELGKDFFMSACFLAYAYFGSIAIIINTQFYAQSTGQKHTSVANNNILE